MEWCKLLPVLFTLVQVLPCEKPAFRKQDIEIGSFDEYKKLLNRTYHRQYDEVRGRAAFDKNFELIRDHNQRYAKGETTFRLRANCFADMNSRRYLRTYVRLVSSQRRQDLDKNINIVGAAHVLRDLPETLDWRDKGFVTTSDNQGSCGSCYAFSIAESIQGQVYKRTGKLLALSEQQILDCSVGAGNHGCSGGSLRNTLVYIQQTAGLMRREDYRYQEKRGRCQFIRELAVVNVSSWAVLPAGDEEAMKVAVATIGPIAVSINASPRTFQLYSEGLYDDEDCSAETVNHAMLVVGYGLDHWILKNWWGGNWGNQGYMRIKRGTNMCGLANYAAYAIV